MPKHQRLPSHTQRATYRFVRLHSKLLIAILVGAIVTAMPSGLRPPTQLLIGWDLGVLCYLGLIFMTMARHDIALIQRRAAEQDEGALAILALSMAATLASLVAIVFELSAAKKGVTHQSIASLLLAATTILLSWIFVHTIFALHYAHEYYGERRDGIIGGLNFPDEKKPDYWDFLYFSLVIGMTSQVSDVAISSRTIRRIAAMHGVLSFFFNVTVVALTINIVSGLI